MTFNFSIKTLDYVYQPSNDCIEWCQYKINVWTHNLQIEGLYLPLIALGAIILHYITAQYSERFAKAWVEMQSEGLEKNYSLNQELVDKTEERILRFSFLMIDFAAYLIVGFFIYVLWLK